MLRGSGCDTKAVTGWPRPAHRAASQFLRRAQRADRDSECDMCLCTLLAALVAAL